MRFLSLWKPRAEPALEATRARGATIVVHSGGRVRKLLHTHTGRKDPRDVAWPTPLSELAERYQSSWVLSLETGALEELMERFGARVRRGDDLIDQSVTLVNVIDELLEEKKIERWPRRLQGVPPPSSAVLRRALDSLCPDEHAMTLGVFKRGELWTALSARRRGTGFDVIAGPEELRPLMGLISGDYRRDYRHLARAVEEKLGPLAFGCYADVDTLERLLVDTRPGAWGRAYAVRDVVVSPIPTGIGLAIGFDGARAAFEGFRALTGRSAALRALDPVFDVVRRKVGDAVGDRDVAHVLGFDPLGALRALLKR